jgi:uncharacterized protein YozE (UPF0346 family)
VVDVCAVRFTTKAQRTQRRHRGKTELATLAFGDQSFADAAKVR